MLYVCSLLITIDDVQMWVLKKTVESKVERTKMRVLRWIADILLRDHLRYEEVGGRAKVEALGRTEHAAEAGCNV